MILPSNPPSDTLCGRAYIIASQLRAYVDPVPAGEMSVAQRDALSAKLAVRWTAKVARGEASCAWHEIAEHWGTRCMCAACAPQTRRLA